MNLKRNATFIYLFIFGVFLFRAHGNTSLDAVCDKLPQGSVFLSCDEQGLSVHLFCPVGLKSDCKVGGALSVQVTPLNDTFNLAVYKVN